MHLAESVQHMHMHISVQHMQQLAHPPLAAVPWHAAVGSVAGHGAVGTLPQHSWHIASTFAERLRYAYLYISVHVFVDLGDAHTYMVLMHVPISSKTHTYMVLMRIPISSQPTHSANIIVFIFLGRICKII